MATTRDPSTTTLPSAPFANPGGGEQTARAFERIGDIARGLSQTFMHEMKQDALREAQENAPSLITYDEKGAVLPPRDVGFFEGGGAYKDALRRHSRDLYRTLAMGEMSNKQQELTTLYPTDPDRVKSELDAYTKEKLAAMPPDLARSMVPHFNAAIAGAASSALIGRDRANRQQGLADTEKAVHQLVIDQARDLPAAEQMDPRSLQTNLERFKDRRETLSRMMKVHGKTDEEIKGIWDRADMLTMSRSFGRELYQSVLQGGPGARVPAEERAVAFARKHGRHEADILTVLRHEIARGDSNRAAIEAGQGQAVAQENGNIGIELIKLQRGVRDGTVPPDALVAAREKMFAATMSNPNLRPQDRLARLQTIEGSLTPAIAQGYQSLVADAQTVITTPGMPPERVTAARQTLAEVRDNTQAMSAIGHQGRHLVHSSIASANVAAGALGEAQVLADIDAGRASPAEIRGYVEGKAQRNEIGVGRDQTHPDRIKEIVSKGMAAWEKEGALRSLGMSELRIFENSKTGVPPISAREAIEKVHKFQPLNPNVRYDPVQPGVLEHTLNYAQKTGFLPSQFATWASELNADSTVEQRTALVQAYATLREFRMQRAAGNDHEKKETTDAWLKYQFGPGYNNAFRVATEGVEAKLGTTPSGTGNPDRQAGSGNSEHVKNELAAHLTGVAALGLPTPTLVEDATRGMARLIMTNSPFHSGADLAKLGLFSDEQVRNVLQPLLRPSGVDGTRITGDNIVIEPQAAGFILAQARQELAETGLDHAQRGVNPHRQALVDALTKAQGQLGVSLLPNGKYQLEFRPFTATLNRKYGSDYSQKEATDFAVSTFVSQGRVRNWDPGTETIRAIPGRESSLYRLTGYTKDGSLIHIGDLDINDPRIKPGLDVVSRQVAKDIKNSDVLGILREVGADGVLHGWMKSNYREGLLEAAAGKLDHPSWVKFVQNVRRVGGLLEDGRDDAWRSLEQPAAAMTMARRGWLYYLINGADETEVPGRGMVSAPVSDPHRGDPAETIPRVPREAELTVEQQRRQRRLREIKERDERALQERE